jgi:phage/plasmid-associated DNA primase
MEVEYEVRGGMGRYRSARGEDGSRYSQTSMPRDVRAWLAGEAYWDVDMSNSQPALAAQMMREAGLEVPRLSEYVRRREEVLRETMRESGVERSAAKRLYLSVCYGGTWERWAREEGVCPTEVSEFARELQTEMRWATAALMEVHEDAGRAEEEQRRWNPEARNATASRFAYVTQEAERRCLEAMVESAEGEGREVGALIHDGLLLRRAAGGETEREVWEVLRRMEARVREATGYEVRLEVKAWETNPIYAAASAAAMEVTAREAVALTEGALTLVSGAPTEAGGSTHTLTEAESESVKGALGLREHGCGSWSAEDLEGGRRWRMRAVGCGECLVDPRRAHAGGAEGGGTWRGCGMMMCRGGGVTLMCDVSGERRELGARQREAVLRAFGGLWGGEGDTEEVKATALAKLLRAVLEHAVDGRLKRRGGYVWRPVAGSPCAYEQAEECRELLNDVLGEDPRYKWGPPRLQRELLEYLKNYNPREFREVERDLDLVSFSDGVLVLSEGRFVGNDAATKELTGRVARHHIASSYEERASYATPLWDGVLGAQMSGEVARTLEALLGRLLFAVGEKDRWQVMPYLVGDAGTGKSLVLEIATAMFAPSSTASLSGTQEATFGLEGKWDKELIVGRDMPRSLSRVLEASLLQSMVTGEGVSVAQKGKEALDLKAWHVPLIMASNHMPDYLDSAGQISRRIVAFSFRGEVRSPDTTLLDRMLRSELPAIMRKVLDAYLEASREHGGEGFVVWCPAELRESRRAVQLETDYVRRFLAAGPEENEIYVVQRSGRTTTLTEFKEAFGKYMRYKHRGVSWKFDDEDRKPFVELGYEVKKVPMCKSCGGKAQGGGEGRRCCANYGMANRVNLVSIVGMEVVYRGDESPVQSDPLD